MSLALVQRPPVDRSPVLAKRRYADAGEGRTLAYVEAGSGPPVLLIHGAMVNLDDMLLGPFDALAREHRVIAFDRPGHGGSGRRRFEDASPWRQAGLIRNAATALGAERPLIVGHSFGGAVALAYAMAYPDETAAVLALAPLVWPEPRLELFLFGPRTPPGVGDLLSLGSHRTLDPALLPLLWRAMFLPQAVPERFLEYFSFGSAGDPAALIANGEDAFAGLTSLWRSALAYPRCRTPVRILGGDRDAVVNNAAHGALLGQVLPAGRFSTVQGMGHMLHHFAIDEILAAVQDLGG